MQEPAPSAPLKKPRWWLVPVVAVGIMAATLAAGIYLITRIGETGSNCFWTRTAQAWVDSNNNGTRDAGEPPLPGVTFHVSDSANPNSGADISGSTTDSKGETAVWRPGCSDATFVISPDVPAGMKLTTPERLAAGGRGDKPFAFGFAYLPGVPTGTPPPPGPKCQTFTDFTPRPEKSIGGLVFAPDGALWGIIYGPSVARLDPVTHHWETFTASDGPAYADLTGQPVYKYYKGILVAPDGEVWVMNSDGIMRVRDNHWLVFPAIDEATPSYWNWSASFDVDGTLWVANVLALWQLDPETGQVLSRYPIVGIHDTNSRPTMIFPAPDGSIWLPNSGETLRLFPPAQPGDQPKWLSYYGSFGVTKDPHQSPLNYVDSIAAAPDGSLWFAYLDGVAHYDPKTDLWENYGSSTPNSPVPDYIKSIRVAPDGSIWFGGGSQGPVVYHFIPASANYPVDTWLKYDSRDGLPHVETNQSDDNEITDIAIAPDRAVWFGSYSGLTRCVFPK